MSEIDVVVLSRLQFAFTISFHIIFPALTIGISGFLVLVEALWLRTGDEAWRRLYQFWVRLFALSFGMGVVSGIVLSYEFGTNWGEFSRIVGPVIGPLMAYEVLTAFFMEAGFLGIMLFGWDKVGPRLHFLATCLVGAGTTVSAFWIVSANSWMQTPQGAHFDMAAGHFVPDDWFAIIFNPSFPYRLAHMVAAAYLASALVIAGVSAIYLLAGKHTMLARKSYSIALWAVLVLAPLQIFIGDQHGLNVLEHQPVKVAAMEANWERQARAPIIFFAIPDAEHEKNHFEIGIPGLASLILTHSMNGIVPGLKDVAKEDRPPVGIVFWSFRVMVALGLLFLLIGAWSAWSRWRGKLDTDKWLMRLAAATTPAGIVAILAGWYVAEVGRQPFTVYGQLRTSDSISSVVNASAVTTSLAIFLIVYGGLFGAYLYYFTKIIRVGPKPFDAEPEAMQGARPGLVIPPEDATFSEVRP
ncbi:MAG: cytochrome ubiquinol oxidase subunit I [Parvibaculum sp.]|uniref:cytochrome ubiquinol oxidase subunit I n=1 Tax=Parvibaculum sp. TaxID=2024848 RepID=UPI003C7107E5